MLTRLIYQQIYGNINYLFSWPMVAGPHLSADTCKQKLICSLMDGSETSSISWHMFTGNSSLTRHFWSFIVVDPCVPPGKGGLGSTKFVAFETLAWHNDCFFCHICQDSMVGKGFIQVIKDKTRECSGNISVFIQDGDNIICPECARKKMIEEIEEA